MATLCLHEKGHSFYPGSEGLSRSLSMGCSSMAFAKTRVHLLSWPHPQSWVNLTLSSPPWSLTALCYLRLLHPSPTTCGSLPFLPPITRQTSWCLLRLSSIANFHKKHSLDSSSRVTSSYPQARVSFLLLTSLHPNTHATLPGLLVFHTYPLKWITRYVETGTKSYTLMFSNPSVIPMYGAQTCPLITE